MQRNRGSPARRVARLRVADLEIDALDRRVIQGTRSLRLSPSEHILLYVLAAKAGKVADHRELGDALGLGAEARANTIARHITTLRRKLAAGGKQREYIVTVRLVGYRFLTAPAEVGRRLTPPPR